MTKIIEKYYDTIQNSRRQYSLTLKTKAKFLGFNKEIKKQHYISFI